MVGRVRRTGRVVDEERLVGRQRLLLADPLGRAIRHVLREVVALLRCPVRLDRHRVLVDGGCVLVRLAPDEAVEVLEAAAAGRPAVKRPHGARLPDGDLVALAELRGRVAVEFQRLSEWRCRLRPDGVVPGRRCCDLGDPAHPYCVVVPAGQQGLSRRGAERRRVEAVVAEPVRCESFEVRGLARAAETRTRTRTPRRRSGSRARSALLRAAGAARSGGTWRRDPWRPSPRWEGPAGREWAGRRAEALAWGLLVRSLTPTASRPANARSSPDRDDAAVLPRPDHDAGLCFSCSLSSCSSCSLRRGVR